MPVPAAIQRVSAVGLEASPGAGGTVTKRFASFGLSKSPQYNIGSVTVPGVKYTTKHYLSGEWSEFSIEDGALSYDEVLYPLAGICRKATPTTPTGATAARLWTFDSDAFSRDDVQTYVIESGIEGGRGGKAAYGIFTEWGFSAARSGETVEMSGSLVARKITQQALTDVPLGDFVPVTPAQINLYIDDSHTALGTTQLQNAFNFEFSLGDRQTPVWFLNRAIDSFAATVESRPSAEITLTVADEMNPVDDVLASLRAGDRVFIRFEALGPEIEAGFPHRFTADFACQVSDAPSEGDEDDAASVELTFELEVDGDWGKAFEISVQNAVEAL